MATARLTPSTRILPSVTNMSTRITETMEVSSPTGKIDYYECAIHTLIKQLYTIEFNLRIRESLYKAEKNIIFPPV